MRFLIPQKSLTSRLPISSLLLGVCSLCLSLLLSFYLAPLETVAQDVAETSTDYGMVDPVDPQFSAGYSIYIEQCATCHVALPPAVLPMETWQALVTDSAHYGVALPTFSRFDQQLMLNYLQTYSRRNLPGEATPYRLEVSTYFQALHPKVELPQALNLQSCVGCHQSATEQNYLIYNQAH